MAVLNLPVRAWRRGVTMGCDRELSCKDSYTERTLVASEEQSNATAGSEATLGP